MILQFFEKDFGFSEISLKSKVLKTFKIYSSCHIKTCQSFRRSDILKIPSTLFLEEPKLYNETSKSKRMFPVLRQKPTQILP